MESDQTKSRLVGLVFRYINLPRAHHVHMYSDVSRVHTCTCRWLSVHVNRKWRLIKLLINAQPLGFLCCCWVQLARNTIRNNNCTSKVWEFLVAWFNNGVQTMRASQVNYCSKHAWGARVVKSKHIGKHSTVHSHNYLVFVYAAHKKLQSTCHKHKIQFLNPSFYHRNPFYVICKV